MKIGIHRGKGSYHDRWIAYCKTKGIAWKLVDCYRSDIVQQLADCDALMWHFHHAKFKDYLFAKQLLFSLQVSGKVVFPDFNTAWHFDDKLGQKYLLEAMGAPLVPSWAFYDKQEALQWAKKTDFPKVFKLRGGAGSANVRLVRNRHEADKLICRAFGRGFPVYDAWGSLKERWRLYRLGKTGPWDLVKGILRFVVPPPFARAKENEKGYIYFQEFIPGNDHDVKVLVVGGKACAIQRMTRKNDFRASGSGNVLYDKDLFDEATLKLAFQLTEKLKAQCVAFDIIYKDAKPLIMEIGYGLIPKVFDPCPGYWDTDLNWHEEKFDFCGWMVDLIVKTITSSEDSK